MRSTKLLFSLFCYCCVWTVSSQVKKKICRNANAECFCPEGLQCLDRECTTCEKKECKKGEELIIEGRYKNSFHCEPCPDNTYSDTWKGICKNFTRCAEGLDTIFAGNQTHDAECGMKLTAPQSACMDWGFWSGVAVGVLFEAIVFLSIVCLWSDRKKKTKSKRYCTTLQETRTCPLSVEERGK
ncbi:tumor necrosis factor receptor superfamily member 18 isoform X2 [Denticeps clupeoides]|uniref:tumor necrosis factor receptor superfamily member 18 isoform X2 n=1 Tax=Denticeps clupeoides TaxID=299321 RepID=UPI0010A57CF8|nr:tumor necrosis factor receptor superfamily member 18-like isoform X2 [Denticeps clupeoides]